MELISAANVSKNNSINPNTRSEEASPCFSEESGWTIYFEDFLASKENKGVSMASSVSLSSSLISDGSFSRFTSMNKTKRKKRGALCNYEDDDLLEDTACSTLNTNIHHEEMENGYVKQRNPRDQAGNGLQNRFDFQAAKGLTNGFDFGLDLVHGISKIECTALQYKRRHLTTFSSYVQGC